MLARSRNRIGRARVGGLLLLSLALASGSALAAAGSGAAPASAHPAHRMTKADSLKAKQAAAAKHATAVKGATAGAKPPAPATGVHPRTTATIAKTAGTTAAKTAPPQTKPVILLKSAAVKNAAPPAKPANPASSAALPAKAKPTPPSRLATLPTAAPTRATAMPHPQVLRASIAAQAKPARTPAAKSPSPAQATAKPVSAPPSGPLASKTSASRTSAVAPRTATMVPAAPRGAVTLTPAAPSRPVPMGIPVGNSKLATGGKAGKGSEARIMAATAGGLAVVSGIKATAPSGKSGKGGGAGVPAGIPAGPQVSKMTLVGPAAPPTAGKGATAAPAHQGSVTPLPRAAEGHTKIASGVGKASTVVTPTALEDQVTYQYNALGRRDPFNSLLEGDFVGNDVGGDAPPDLGGLKVVGIMWGSQDQFAMVEDVKGNSFVLRRGDKVMNGFVEGLKRDAMIVNITVDGQSQSVTVPITRKGEKANANR